ncbi:hypothetical protein [Parasphingorhabdus sp.]|uniref:hypothetical protein n=1 Tax=Parasphingorhabdus sp. TaxID=2709688 RepID=UPI0030B76A4F|nr:hypothetical protein [Sphingomonadales bacterium]
MTIMVPVTGISGQGLAQLLIAGFGEFFRAEGTISAWPSKPFLGIRDTYLGAVREGVMAISKKRNGRSPVGIS